MTRSDAWTREDHRRVLGSVRSQLWRVVGPHAALGSSPVDATALLGVPPAQARHLARLHFVLDPQVEKFTRVSLPSLLQGLRRSRRAVENVGRETLRGRVDWGRTVNLRAQSGDSSLFATVESRRDVDLIENRILKHVLEVLYQDAIALSSPTAVDHASFQDDEPRRWGRIAQAVAQRCEGALRNVYLQEVRPVEGFSEAQAEKLYTLRARNYADVADVALRLLASRGQSEAFLRDALSERFLAPLNWDTLYELWALFAVLRAAEDAGYAWERNPIIGGPGGRFRADLQGGNARLRIRYQALPDRLAKVSRYADIMERYGLEASSRRPDILVELDRDGSTRTTVVEVKRSSQRPYIADGLYKLFGYVADYEKAWNEDSEEIQGVLLAWQLPRPGDEGNGTTERVLVADHRTFPSILADVVKGRPTSSRARRT